MHGSGFHFKKSREKGKDLYKYFMDLEKANDKVDRSKLCEVLSEYEIEGKDMENIRAFYRKSKACVRVIRIETEFFM